MGLLSPLFAEGNENQRTDSFVLKTLVDAVKHLDSPQAKDQVTQVSVALLEEAPPVFLARCAGTLVSVKAVALAGSLELELSHDIYDDELTTNGAAAELLSAPVELAANDVVVMTFANVVDILSILLVFTFRPVTVPE